MAPAKYDFLKTLCKAFVLEQPEAMGLAYMELDCGCINTCGVSAKGDPVGQMEVFSSKSQHRDTICFKCSRDKRIDWNRVVEKGLIWPGEDSERPDQNLRLKIGKRVFGSDYSED